VGLSRLRERRERAWGYRSIGITTFAMVGHVTISQVRRT
jgi:hypothetical protein